MDWHRETWLLLSVAVVGSTGGHSGSGGPWDLSRSYLWLHWGWRPVPDPGQVALVDAGHFVSEIHQLTGPQRLDEGLHPADPPPKAVEELPEGALVPRELARGPQSVLVTCGEAGQIRQDLWNMNAVDKIAVMVANILVSLILSKRHRCPGSEVTEGSGP